MISNSLTEALKESFPDVPFVYDPSTQPFARLTADCDEVRTLEIYDDGDEATVTIHKISHSHFNPYRQMPELDRDKWIADAVIDFLAALFTDRLSGCLVYRSRSSISKSRSAAGWIPPSRFTDRPLVASPWHGAV